MITTSVLRQGAISVLDYRCNARPTDVPIAEQHTIHSVSYVRKGSFGCRCQGKTFELVAGSVLVGHAGDEYLCTHEHHAGGDECLSFQLRPELVETIGDRSAIWRVGAMPPLPELMVLGELAQAAASGRSDIGLDEAALLFTARFVELVDNVGHRPPPWRGPDRWQPPPDRATRRAHPAARNPRRCRRGYTAHGRARPAHPRKNACSRPSFGPSIQYGHTSWSPS